MSAARFDGFADAVAAIPAPADEVGQRAAIVSAAHEVARQCRADTGSTGSMVAISRAAIALQQLVHGLPQ